MKTEAQLKAEIERLQRSMEKQAIELESKNRELEIEAALERVRSRTMDMHQSNELLDTAKILFHQFQELGIGLHVCGFGIPDKDKPTGIQYLSIGGTEFPEPVPIRFDKDPYLMKAYEDWKLGKTHLIFDIQGEELENHLAGNADQFKDLESADILAKQAAKYSKGQAQQPQRLVVHHAFFKHGILFLTNDRPIENIEILVRFAKVFDQTYTRFLDLQKAEAQAREAQIEAGLERVRAASMAMHKSEELSQVVAVIYEEINRLGFTDWGCSIIICDIQASVMRYWYAETNMPHLEGFCNVPLTNKIAKKTWDLWQSGIPQFDINLLGKEKEDYTSFMLNNTDYNQMLPEEVKKGWLKPKDIYLSYFTLKFGMLEFVDIKPLNRENYPAYERFAKVFEQTYTRFLDLQKAEAQAREAQIEAGLERVRAASMAMHKSEELVDVVRVLDREQIALGIEFNGSQIITDFSNINEGLNSWFAREGQGYLNKFHIPFSEEYFRILTHPTEDGLPFYTEKYSKEEKNKFFRWLFKYSDFKIIPKERQEFVYQTPGWVRAVVRSKNSILVLQRFSLTEFTKEEEEIFKRFGKVFEQAYTRFLDLKKAEAQAREAQIEVALERVRARTMAMHKSDELTDTASQIYVELESLGIKPLAFGFNIWVSGKPIAEAWSCAGSPDIMWKMNVPHNIDPYLKKIYKGKNSGADLFSETVKGKALKKHFEYMKTIMSQGELSDDSSDLLFHLPESMYMNAAYFKQGYLLLTTLFKNEEVKSILVKFAKVFEQTYTRFLDLQKAEAQTREAEIEAALERVRSRSMAMHQTNELNEVSMVLYEELIKLGFQFVSCGFEIILEKEQILKVWNHDFNQGQLSHFQMPLKGDNTLKMRYEAWKDRKAIFLQELKGIALNDHLRLGAPENVKYEENLISLFNFPDPAYFCLANFSKGCLHVIGNSQIQINHQKILIRFATVFEQAYTRFLDLQKAEAQAREAQIEAALERVRSRTMAMQKSEELTEVAGLLFNQVSKMGIKVWTAGFNVWSKDNNYYTDYVTSPQGEFIKPYKLDTQQNPVLKEISDARKSGVDYFMQYAEGEDLKQMYLTLTRFMDEKQYEIMLKEGNHLPSHQYNHFVFGQEVSLMFVLFEAVPEAQEIFRRFGQVFEQTYTRFLDLQKAETQAREAQIEVALEKIRNRTLLMKDSAELNETVSVFFQQFDLLELLPKEARTYFSHVDTNTDTVQVWMTHADGRVMSGSHFTPLNQSAQLKAFYSKWKKDRGIINIRIYQEEELANYMAFLATLPHVAKDEDYQKLFKSPPDQIVMTDAGFLQGFLGIMSFEPLKKEALEILSRFAKAFEFTYTRFLDLQKAEAQAREAEIEAGLERVRSASMAMHRSEELEKVVEVTFRQLQNLRLPIDGCQLITFEDQSKDFHFWSATPDMIYPTRLNIPYFDHPLFSNFWEARDRGDTFISFDLTRQETLDFYNHLYDKTNLGISVTKERWERIQSIEHGFKTSWGIQKNTGLWVFNFTNHQFTEEENSLIDRFARVFEQTYTRFLDLQKAEVQAREAEIEAALERVRSKAMAMHNTSDLANANSVVFNELNSLGITPLRSGIGLIEAETKQGTMYATVRSDQGNNLLLIGEISLQGNEVLESIFDHWNKKKIYCPKLNGKELQQYYDLILASYGDLPKPKFSKNEVQYGYFLPFKHGCFYAWTQEPFSEDKLKTIQRFVSVIDLTYNRYFDLQKAEAQAREAEIQLALERVRARTMAMQRSDELKEVVAEVFEKLSELDFGLKNGAAIIHIFNDDSKDHIEWIADPSQIFPKGLEMPFFENPLRSDIFNAWQSGLNYYSKEYSKEIKDDFFAFTFQHTDYKNIDKKIKEVIQKTGKYSYTIAFGKNTAIGIPDTTGRLFTAQEEEILTRFAKVFEQTYTRFLDLQKAEAQAREAQIEAALERVRSQSMAMQHSGELNLILAKVFEELTNLELQMERAVIWIYYPENKSVRWWAANPEAESGTDSFLITNQDHPVYLEYWKCWEEKRTKNLYILEGENMVSWCDVLFNEMELGRLPMEVQEAMRAPEKVYLYNTFNDFGVLFLACIEPLSDDKFSVLERFGKVFDQSYTRFKDIKQAEAREKEAIKQSSLDRVRAEIASMRKTEDLQRITPLIWRELLTLGVPFFRCGLMIINEKEEKVHFYLSTPDGKPLAALNLDYESNEVSSNGVKHWKKQQPYIAHWNKEEFLAFTNTLLEQQQIENSITYQGGEEPPESLTLQFIPFPQGMLYVGSTADLTSVQIDLVQNLADAFSVAYARYEDFKQLEDAKSKIEYTLSELKSTQAQLIQSEKMASLGELTAGIAHEIQNPLNFVNNFSEVSDELVDEMNEELENGDIEEAKAIGKDLKENLSKINLHGKRADAIVKGMLEHSRANKGEKAPTDLNALVDEFVRLSFHGLRAKDKSFNADFKLDLDPNLPKVNLVASDIGRVILNLVNNAFYAVHEKAKTVNADSDYKPIVTVSSTYSPLAGEQGGVVELSVQDNGPGIPDSIKEKIFQPFFTTKPTGSGTGLGLSLSYDIVKAHGGEIIVKSSAEKGTVFILTLPIK
ncbi:hypothetical protein JYB62_13375 [Algoriphagus lutimaris]|uniref:sensor histidine kinase n=1 Tax=Algoriphagus lutimaris TaxID=613197 RepID=UPI00196ADFAA|nr:ATP-binding protein [Algoriphagus lutimaris]MBN3520994.1 hypothetical protein [Algoriphagus lutimaris]